MHQNCLNFSSFFVCDAGSCFQTHQDDPKTLLVPKTIQDAPGRILDSVWGELGGYWVHLGPQDGRRTRPRPAQEPAKTPPKIHLGARTRPDTQNSLKMKPRPPQNDAPHPSFWIDADVNFGYLGMTSDKSNAMACSPLCGALDKYISANRPI